MNDIADLKHKVSLLGVARGKTRMTKKGDRWWGCCPIHGEKTPSFEVRTKDGLEVFYCHGCKKGGDIVTFLEEVEKLQPKQAIQRLKELAGESGPRKEYLEKHQQVEQSVGSIIPTDSKTEIPMERWKSVEDCLQNNAEALKWLLERRGISAETAKNLHLGYDNKGHIVLPRIAGDKVVAIKYRSMKDKAFFSAKNMDFKTLFNINTIDPFEPIFVTEGEFDAAILEQCGYRAVSVPCAGVKLLPDMKKALKQADCIFLAGDNDGGVGNAYMKQLARELGENCYILTWPGVKDANDFFLKTSNRDENAFRSLLEPLLEKSRQTPVEGFSNVLDRLQTTQGTDVANDPTRLHFPWPEVDKMNYSPTGSIVILYSTYSGTGKTVLATQIGMHEAKRGETVVVYSPEVRDENYLALLAAQNLGPERDGGLDRAGKVTGEDYRKTADLIRMTYHPDCGGPKEPRQIQFYVGFSLPESDTDKILDFIEFTVRVTGATRFIIDTLHRIIAATGKESLVETEGRVVKRLESIANQYGTIFILIGQSNKEAEGVKETNRNEYGKLRGSRELTDVAYGVYLIHRARVSKDSTATVNLLSPDTELVLIKDRGKGPGNATVPMFYRRDCSKFVVRETTHTQPFESKGEDGLF